MTYTTQVTGCITVTPPLEWAEIKDSKFIGDDGVVTVLLNVKEREVETGQGPLFRKEANAIRPVREDGYRAYDLVDHVQEILDRYGDRHRFTGRFDCEGDSAADMWRLIIEEGPDGRPRAVRIDARVVWPEDLEPLARAADALQEADGGPRPAETELPRAYDLLKAVRAFIDDGRKR